jgi:flagellar biogenesis protein FliO
MTWVGDPMLAISLVVATAGIALLGVLWWRNRQPTSGQGRIELVTTRYLGGKRVLTLVDVEGERLLLALSGNTVSLVAHLRSRNPGERTEPCGEEPPVREEAQ